MAEVLEKPIAVFVHAHYPDIWDWMARRIEDTLHHPFHLILTTSGDAAALRLPDTPFLVSHRRVSGTNRGRDIRPFLQALRDFGDYEIGLKLHTKRSTHRLDGADWGRMLVEALLPDPDAIDRLIDRMKEDARLALVSPDGMLVSMNVWMGDNRAPMHRAALRLREDLPAALRRTSFFAAGSMFWFRRSALEPFLKTDLDDLFELEQGQVDGTTAHAVERLFSLVAEARGGVVTTMEGVARAEPEMKTEALRALSRQLADRPNDFLVPVGPYMRLLMRIPGLKTVYMRLPTGLRRRLRALRQSVGKGTDLHR